MTDSTKSRRHDGLRMGIPAQFAEAEIAEDNASEEVRLRLKLQPTHLIKPFNGLMRNRAVSGREASYCADGFVLVEESGAPQVELPVYGPRDPRPVGRPVTIDMSVYLRGIHAEDFGAEDVLFVSAAMAADLAVYFLKGTRRDGGIAISFQKWVHSVPVPLDAAVIELASNIAHNASELGTGRLTRTDLLCAATALHYAAPLYTTDPEKYDGIGKGLKLIQYGPPLLAPAEKTEPDWDDTNRAINAGRAVSDRLIAPLLDPLIPLADRAYCILQVFTRTAADDRGWKDAILAIADQLPFRELDDDLRQHLIGALGGGWPAPRPRKVFDVIGGWGIWPTDASDEILAELADETYDWGALDWYRSYLLWGGLDPAHVDEELVRVERGEAVPSRQRIDELIQSRE